jgi:prepilin-type N-terminal cleavage/methylation domain-containing protein
MTPTAMKKTLRSRPPLPRAASGAAGFSLIEVMIAMSILATITVLVWGSFQQTFRTRRLIEGNLTRYRAARVAMDRILRDVQMAYLSQNNVPGTEQTARTFFEGQRRPDIDELRFSYFGHQRLYADSKEADTAAVGYFSGRDPDDPRRLNLYRKETRRLQAERFENIPGEVELLCDDVVRLEIGYYHPDRKEWIENWRTTSADGFPNRLPSRVRLRLIVHDENGNEMVFQSETRLAMIQLLDTGPQGQQ